jgi:hypothetical protein
MARKKSGRPVSRSPLLWHSEVRFLGFARGQDGLGVLNFSKNDNTISIIEQCRKGGYTAAYTGIGESQSLAARSGFGGTVFPPGLILPEQILPNPASVDVYTSANFVDHGDVKSVVVLELHDAERKGRLFRAAPPYLVRRESSLD